MKASPLRPWVKEKKRKMKTSKMSLKDFLFETDTFQQVIQTYLKTDEDSDDKDCKKTKVKQKTFKPKKWREYLQYVNIANQ